MSRRKLSDSYIAKLKPAPAGRRRDVYDDQVPGLLLRVTDAGTKSLMLYAKWPGQQHFERRLIGRHGAITIEQARTTARAWKEQLRHGHDPRVVAEEQRLAALRAQQQTFAQVVDDYVAYIHDEGQRKARTVERELRSVFVATWGERPIASLTLHDVRAVITPIVRRGAKYHAHTLFGYVRTLFRWAIGSGAYGLEHSPCDHLQPRQLIGKKASRRRVLDNDELRALWAATGRLGDPRLDGYPWQPLFRLLLLTGQRKTEISDAQWGELDLAQRLLTIPEARFKSNAQCRPSALVGQNELIA
jgi:integrase